MRKLLLWGLVLGGLAASAYEFQVEKGIAYYDQEKLANEGEVAQKKCLLDVRWPVGVTNFATVINIHGGGLVKGGRHFAPWPEEAKDKDPVAGVAVAYRFLTETTPTNCIADAAAAVAWTLKNISKYGGDPKKVFVTGISGGGYLTAMIGMDPQWLGAWGYKTTDLAGIIPLTGQVTKHFNVRAVSFKDKDPTYAPKIDPWSPLYWVREKEFPPSLFLTGGRLDNEMPCRVEENEFLGISMRRCGHTNCSFIETEGSHGGGVEPSSRYLRDFVMKWCDADGVGRFADGERVVFVGDSITHGGWYEAYLQLFQNLRRPGCGTRIMNAGISGDSAQGGDARLKDDVLAMKPDRAFVMFGMNDVGRPYYEKAEPVDAKQAEARQRRLDVYNEKQRSLAARLPAAGVKTVFMTPSPYDQYADAPAENLAGCNEPGLSTCSAIVRDIARENHFGLIEMFNPMTEIFKANPTAHFCKDRVHPGSFGHLIMAAQILDQMRYTPIVAQVSLDAKTGKTYPRSNKQKMPETRNAVVSSVHRFNDGVSFTYAPKALPFPKSADYEMAEKYYPLTARLNQELVVVTNLVAGSYDLAFDGVKVGTFSADEFLKGVNVALLATPNQKRAQELLPLIAQLQDIAVKRRQLELNRIRIRGAKIDPKDQSAALACLEAWLAKREAENNRHIGAYRTWVKTYREWAPREGELVAAEEDVRERLNAVRPAVSRVTITRVP